jgi:hypothetical protein
MFTSIKSPFISITLFIGLAGGLTLQSSSALAALGDAESSIQRDQTGMTGQFQITDHGSYRLHEAKSGQMLVHEYVTPDGKVFGVSWQGSIRPNLKELFGSYYSDYQSALHSSQEQTGRLRLRSRSMVSNGRNFHVEIGGHMGFSRGCAWIPSLIPSGFNTNEIR